jgi:hypothetical protein
MASVSAGMSAIYGLNFQIIFHAFSSFLPLSDLPSPTLALSQESNKFIPIQTLT